MRFFRAAYKDRSGVVRESAKVYGEFRDHLERVRRVPLYTDEKASHKAGERIEALVSLKLAGAEPDADMTRWIATMDADLRDRLASIGLLDTSRVEAPKSVAHLLDVTAREPERFGMTGPERALLYRLAVESGLRAGELATLSARASGWTPTRRTWRSMTDRRRTERKPTFPCCRVPWHCCGNTWPTRCP